MKAMIWIAAALVVAPLTAVAAQQSIDAPGTVPHAAAGTGFPERVGEFRRASVVRYDPAGRDISASYNLVRPEGRLVITVYVYPASAVAPADRAAACRQHFDVVQEVIQRQYKDVSVIESGNVPALAGTEPALSHRAVYRLQTSFDQQVQTVRSEARLYCYVGGDWLVKYRATTNGTFDPSEAIESFIRAGPWPGRVPLEQTVGLPAPLPALAAR